MSKPTELPDLDKLEAYATSSKNGDWHATEAMMNMLDEDDILALVVAARRAQPEGEAPQAGAVHPQFDASKGIYWFSVLLKCARLLDLPDDEPIPSGVLKAVEALVSQPESGVKAATGVESDEFNRLLGAWMESRDYYQSEDQEETKACWAAFIAHVEAWGRIALAVKAEAQAPVEQIVVPKWDGQFSNFQDWVNRASRVLTVRREAAVCVDTKGRRCHIGKDFMLARDEGAFPVRYFWDCELVAQQAAAPGALVAILRDVHDTLASESDSDIDHFEDDDEEREGAPVQYAARKVMEVIDLIEAAAGSAAGTTEALADPVVEANRKLLLERSSVGIGKYGKTLADADLTAPALVQHALEEALDLANYLQAILRKQRVAELDGSRGEVHG